MFCFEVFSFVSTTRTVFIVPSLDDGFIMAYGFFIIDSFEQKKRKRKKPRYWIRSFVRRRLDYGTDKIMADLVDDDIGINGELRLSFHNFVRMSSHEFENLLNVVGPKICKQNTNYRDAITVHCFFSLIFYKGKLNLILFWNKQPIKQINKYTLPSGDSRNLYLPQIQHFNKNVWWIYKVASHKHTYQKKIVNCCCRRPFPHSELCLQKQRQNTETFWSFRLAMELFVVDENTNSRHKVFKMFLILTTKVLVLSKSTQLLFCCGFVRLVEIRLNNSYTFLFI